MSQSEDDMSSSSSEPPIFTPEQQECLKFYWDEYTVKEHRPRPPKSQSRKIAERISEMGPPVTVQIVGIYFAQRLADETGTPRITKKTDEQLQLLQDSFNKDPYPTTGELILLVHKSNLTRRQVQTWFRQQRHKTTNNGGVLNSANGPQMDSQAVVFMWNKYRNDGVSYVVCLEHGVVSPVNGGPGPSIPRPDYKTPAERNLYVKSLDSYCMGMNRYHGHMDQYIVFLMRVWKLVYGDYYNWWR
ncbi:hypothetical protein HYALB_00005165 [Hymenoscyphus albidus]|uniref:Homeobox domain-containing protein n=1 Tax=Hymenoscyphus albidus TaxID=595503 RepID=A0A9N9LUP7_9HELO|nr:hypothetical protein HYALB_00005165 [Hymenoscyphus albidus]